ncbi:LytTR family DNA-binding domain-containing protein [Undibacterium cyanobacteriorum]|uniref:LytTR family DNA-binding domain-containing protein n=1 Tax=Undibacterium cyanobacteriorum TaxID=3073561 RepID=A0ABY9RFB1_9BURK|nr:LytTR family DNA-binding domain-containing protein [Undibacterium sp. 20NA77.5]WMW79913.1 LytTR family DNA-binding domain-containing protein [Undibacterium sp. 20NA77.5]
MTNPTAIIADDEDLQRLDLKRMLKAVWPELNIVAECEDGGDALDAIANLQPDIAFLDIRMPEINGLDVARASDGKCRVVFTTAFDNHAIEAFKLGAIDYLLKPITDERLQQSIDRIKAQMETGALPQNLMQVMAALDQKLRAPSEAERIKWISASLGNTIKLFPIDEVLFFESDLRYTRVVSAKDEGHIRTSIKELQKGLDPDQFWQIHRSVMVNPHAIARARRDEMGNIFVELRDHPEQLKVSQTYAWRFKSM